MKATENNLQHALQSANARAAHRFSDCILLLFVFIFTVIFTTCSPSCIYVHIYMYTTYTQIYLCNERLSNNFHFTFELID